MVSKRQLAMATSTILKHRTINRAYSGQHAVNALSDRLRNDASKSNLHELTFKDMVEYSRLFTSAYNVNGNTNGKANGSRSNGVHKALDEKHLIEAAEYVRKQLCVIIARIVIDFQNLPYGVSSNPRIDEIMQTYIDSFVAIKQIPSIKSLADKQLFQETLEQHLASWTQVTVLPNLCLGLLEMAQEGPLQKIEECPYLSNFIDRIITRRFAARVLLGHYMALHESKEGIFDHECDVIEHIENAKNDVISIANKVYSNEHKLSLPRINVFDMRKKQENKSSFIFSGKMVHQFTYELLKNSLRATMEFHGEEAGNGNDINVIVINSNDGDVTLKIADTGGGISRTEMSKIWLYSYTKARESKKHRVDMKRVNGIGGREEEGTQIELLTNVCKIDKYSVTNNPYYIGAVMHENVPMYGLGYGLPLVKAYSEYFGGSCKIHSIDGYGTDAYLFLPSLTRSKSNVLSTA
eukprot:CAMPEP_0197022998 /NCGR_PEP_ID=MMETSP1384-20130603/3786_1 /TAXON_ID=29189 /ORGANISM="Ammonia sp." /LENGTH=464 /DNA_ID=CAMNT_0042451135 /DNA_START=241 /DNA_END=1635 /DNA_ORIENTATION=+